MVLITPLLKQLYDRCGLPCDVVGIGKWNQSLFLHMPYVRNVYTIDSLSAPYWLNRSQRELVSNLKACGHNFVWICETNNKSYRLLSRAGILRDNSASRLDLAAVKHEHYCQQWLRLGNESPAGFDYPILEPGHLDTELFVSDGEVSECRQWLGERGLDPEQPIICIQAGSKRTTRRGKANRKSNTKFWDEQNWSTVIDSIIEQMPNAQILLCGVPAEMEVCLSIERLCHHSSSVQAVADDLPMRRLLALLSIAHSCISVDTGPAHAAAALNCPLVVLFGKARPELFKPVSKNSPVSVLVGQSNHPEEPGPDIAFITPSQVLDAWQSVIVRENS